MNNSTRNAIMVAMTPIQWLEWWAGSMFFLFAYFVSLRPGSDPGSDVVSPELTMMQRMTPWSWAFVIGGIWFFVAFFRRAWRISRYNSSIGRPLQGSLAQPVFDMIQDMTQPSQQPVQNVQNNLIVVTDKEWHAGQTWNYTTGWADELPTKELPK